jgi:hypothetical protein
MKDRVESTKEKQKNQDSIVKEKYTIAFASVIELLLLMLELYFMMHADGRVPIIIDIAICMAIVLFFLVLSVIELNQKNRNKIQKQYEELQRAQKATYLATKKYYNDISSRLSVFEKTIEFPTDEIISAQKAIAKVTINRNRENAEALMNSNDELMQHIFEFEKNLADQNTEILHKGEIILEETKKDLLERIKELEEREAASMGSTVPKEQPAAEERIQESDDDAYLDEEEFDGTIKELIDEDVEEMSEETESSE